MYHASSSATCSGSNITPFSGRTPWSTPAVLMRVRVAHDVVVVAREFLVDVHLAFECGEMFVEPIHFHTMFNPLECVIFFLNVDSDCMACDLKLSAALVVATVALHLSEGCRVVEGTRRLSQGVVGSPSGLEEFEKPVGE